jgi:hypothetical protein
LAFDIAGDDHVERDLIFWYCVGVEWKQMNLVEVPDFEYLRDSGWDTIKNLLADRSVSFQVTCYPANHVSHTVKPHSIASSLSICTSIPRPPKNKTNRAQRFPPTESLVGLLYVGARADKLHPKPSHVLFKSNPIGPEDARDTWGVESSRGVSATTLYSVL